MRTYQISEQEGRYHAEEISAEDIEDNFETVGLRRDTLSSIEVDEKAGRALVSTYRKADYRCVYMWLLIESGIAEHYNPAILNEIIGVLS